MHPLLLLGSRFTSYTMVQVLKGLKLDGRRNRVAVLDPSRLPGRKNTPDRQCEVQVRRESGQKAIAHTGFDTSAGEKNSYHDHDRDHNRDFAGLLNL